METFTPVTSRIQTITRSLGRGRFEYALCQLATMLGARLALFLCAAVLVQPCAGTPFQWAFTGSLNQPRAYHTATLTASLLRDGRVLVAGGWPDHTDQGPLSGAELYKPGHGKLDTDHRHA
jgi:hypothetical protein